ncbi:MAG: DNA translocase FtsK [Anaerovoracaceae bacterium]
MASKQKKPGRPPGSKNKTTKKNKASNKNKKASSKKIKDTKENENSRLKEEIAAIILLTLGVFFAIAMHTTLAGAVGLGISNGLKGMFGLGGYVLPYFLITYSFLMFFKKSRPFKIKTVVLIILIFLMIDLINAGRFINDMHFGIMGIGSVFRGGVLLNNGGVFGMYAGLGVVKLIGETGLYLVSTVIIIISLLLIINTPISKAYDDAKLRKEMRRERRSQKEEAKKVMNDEYQQSMFDNDFDSNRNYINSNDFSSNFVPTEKKRKQKSILNLMKEDPNYGLPKVDNFKFMEDKFEEEKIKVNNVIEDIPVSPVVETSIDPPFVPNIKKISDEPVPVKKADVAKVKEELEREITVQNINQNSNYNMPPLSLLKMPKKSRRTGVTNEELIESAKKLEETLKSFNVSAKVVNVTKGSSVTRYEIQPNVGVKVSSIVRLADDIALNLRARSIRMEAPIPGKAAVGIEVENENREMVSIGELVDSPEFTSHESKLVFTVGRDIGGKAIVADLGKMPHLLIAGATGSGKSVCINSIITSILYKASPEEVKMVLIDPKMVELGNYNGIPHLLIPVVTDATKAAAALNWAVAEMTNRYKKFAKEGVRDIKGYNKLMIKNKQDDEVLPKIVVIIDELADLMMVASNQVEDSICRLAQLARAAGMHLIVATQRPSVDVITGLIKANIPSRIAFMVSSQIDSRTIIDMPGAEKLVGNGDMLFKPQDLNKPLRVQGPYISDSEVHNVIDFVKSQAGDDVNYSEEVIDQIENEKKVSSSDDDDELLNDAIELVVQAGQASVSMLQRRFRIGYNRAARIVDIMESRGIVGPQDGSRARAVLKSIDDLNNETEE